MLRKDDRDTPSAKRFKELAQSSPEGSFTRWFLEKEPLSPQEIGAYEGRLYSESDLRDAWEAAQRALPSSVAPTMPRSDEIRLACGELTASEMRTVQAVLKWFITTRCTPSTIAPIDDERILMGNVHYERAPSLDKRIARGDDFAGDAWVRWTAVGHRPDADPETPSTETPCMECRHEPRYQRSGYSRTYNMGWCENCGASTWYSDGVVTPEQAKRDDYGDWCKERVEAWGCKAEAEGRGKCERYCGHPHDCALSLRSATGASTK